MIKKILILALIIGSSLMIYSCSNMYVSGGVGMSYGGGPYGYGPRMSPTMNIGVYGSRPVRW